MCPVRGLTLRLFGKPLLRGARAEEFQKLVLLDLEVFGELLGGHTAGYGFPEGIALLIQQFEGAAVVLFEGAGPDLVGLLDCVLEGLALQDQGGEFDGLVGGVARRRWVGEKSPAVVFKLIA